MIYVFLANGFEETEAIAPIDLLRRAGKQVVTVGVGDNIITGSHGISVVTDTIAQEAQLSDELEMIVLPGGMPGTLNLELCEPLMDQVHGFNTSKKGLAAICAAPTVFGKAGLLQGKKATCYPGMEGDLLGANVSTDAVCHDGHIITSRGLGTAIPLALEIIKTFQGTEAADKIAKSVVYK